jgi:hypothetical protein
MGSGTLRFSFYDGCCWPLPPTAMTVVNVPVVLILEAVVTQCIHGALEKMRLAVHQPDSFVCDERKPLRFCEVIHGSRPLYEPGNVLAPLDPRLLHLRLVIELVFWNRGHGRQLIFSTPIWPDPALVQQSGWGAMGCRCGWRTPWARKSIFRPARVVAVADAVRGRVAMLTYNPPFRAGRVIPRRSGILDEMSLERDNYRGTP